MNDESKDNPPKVPDFNAENDKTREIDFASNRARWLGIAVAVLLGAAVVLTLYLADTLTEMDQLTSESQARQKTLADTQKVLDNIHEKRKAEQADCQAAQDSCEAKVANLESALESTKTAFGALKDEKKQATQELRELKAFSKQFERMISAGKLEIVFRRGRMVVNLPAQVLFDSGSADLSEEGYQALEEVAKVLRTVKNKRFVVGGHTDDRKIKKAKFRSNWELATARALVVTESLIKGGLKPWNLIAAGYAQYAPIASNKNEEGRQKNRRIEIILEPYLKDIDPPKTKSKAARK